MDEEATAAAIEDQQVILRVATPTATAAAPLTLLCLASSTVACQPARTLSGRSSIPTHRRRSSTWVVAEVASLSVNSLRVDDRTAEAAEVVRPGPAPETISLALRSTICHLRVS